MKYNEILEEIYRLREEHARECGYDVDTLFARMRQDLERLKAEGWQVVYPTLREVENACVLREEPPSKPATP